MRYSLISGSSFTLGINTGNYGSGESAATHGTVTAELIGTSDTKSFTLASSMSATTGFAETLISADIGDVYAITITSETTDAWSIDKVSLNNVDF